MRAIKPGPSMLVTLAALALAAGGTAANATAGTRDAARSGNVPFTILRTPSPSASDADPNRARATAREIRLAKFGPFTVYGKCFVDRDSGPRVYGEIYARSNQDEAVLDGPWAHLDGDPAYPTRRTAEADRLVMMATQVGDSVITTLSAPTVVLVQRSGRMYVFTAPLAIKSGALAGGDGPWGRGPRCAFGFSRLGRS